mgnify:CR=1 FL=1
MAVATALPADGGGAGGSVVPMEVCGGGLGETEGRMGRPVGENCGPLQNDWPIVGSRTQPLVSRSHRHGAPRALTYEN